MTRKWIVQVGGEPVEVCGFKRPQRAREHVQKHFLDKSERWELISIEPGPAEFRKSLSAAEEAAGRKHSPEVYAVLDAATQCYEQSVEKNTLGQEIVRSVFYVHTPEGKESSYPAVGLISRNGVFSAFFRAELSDLRTSFRQGPGRTHRGPVRPRDYLNAAHKYLDRKLSNSELKGR